MLCKKCYGISLPFKTSYSKDYKTGEFCIAVGFYPTVKRRLNVINDPKKINTCVYRSKISKEE